jgi:glycosyltransferase involved in cell wall biosynthesis
MAEPLQTEEELNLYIPRVLFVNQTSLLGGGELSLLDITRELPFQNCVALFRDGIFRDRLVAEGVPVEILDPTGNGLSTVRKDSGWYQALGSLSLLARMTWRLQRMARMADCLYANSQKALIVGALAATVARRPLIWHLRDILDAEHFSPAMRRVAVTAANTRASAVIANSQATAEAFISSGGRSKLVHVVHSGVDSRPFLQVSEQEVAHIRKELAPSNTFLVGVFGRLTHWKGQHVVLEAISRLPGVHAICVGDALFGETDYVRALHERAEMPDLRGRVKFLGFRNDLAWLMRAVDVVVHSSINPEPFGRVIIEGMLSRRPVVATAAGGVLEIIDDGHTGLLYPPGESSALMAQIERLQHDAPLRQRLSAAGYQKAQSCFTLPEVIDRIQKITMDVCLSSKKSR